MSLKINRFKNLFFFHKISEFKRETLLLKKNQAGVYVKSLHNSLVRGGYYWLDGADSPSGATSSLINSRGSFSTAFKN